MRRCGKLFAALLALCGWLTAAPAGAATPSEYQLKAVFLFHFAQFVEWPPEVFPLAQSPIVICVLGKDPFGSHLDDVVRGEQVMGRTLEVRRFTDVEDVESCHILFVSRSEREHFEMAVSQLDRAALLVVSDIDRSAERGAIIQFTTAGNRIRLRINVEAAREAGLTLSSKLLRPAEIVATRVGN